MGDNRENRRRSRGGFGKFILGWFTGFICTLLILAGVGYWAYTSVSIKKIEKWTKTDIINNEGVENKTIKDWIAIANNVLKEDTNAYTIAQFEEDFGVKLFSDTMYGIDLTPIKTSPITKIKDGLNEAIDNATFNNILSFMEVSQDKLGLLNTILDSEITYYVNNGKLYVDNSYSTEVEFSYEIDKSNIKLGNTWHTIKTEGGYKVIKPMLRHIPLQTAMSSIEGATKDLKIYEVLGYTREGEEGSYVYKDGGVEVTGIMATLAGYSVGELSNSETFNNLYVYEVMGYYYNNEDGKYYQNYDSSTSTYSNEVTGVLKILVPSTLGELNTTINNLTLGQALDVSKGEAEGVVKALYDTKITELNTATNNLKVYEVMGYYYNGEDGNYYENFDGTSYTNQVSGLMNAIAGSKINELDTTINTIKAKDVFDSSTIILKLFTAEELETLTVMDLPDQATSKINSSTIDYLVTQGIITGVDTSTSYYSSIKDKTLAQLINGTV